MLPMIDLFAGAGGLSIGLARAGFEPVLAAELDNDAADTYSKRHPSAEVLRGDVGPLIPSLKRFRGQVALLAGGPPCQPWSTGGKRMGSGDSRDCLPYFLESVRLVRPRLFLMENVAGLARAHGGSALRSLIGEFEDAGYAVSSALVNAAEYGVPQTRVRLLVVGSLGSQPVPVPLGQHHDQPEKWQPVGTIVSASPRGTPNPSIVTYAKRPSLRPDPYHGQVYNGGGRPLDLARPSPTLLASMGGNKTPWVDTAGVVPEYHAHLLAGGQPRTGTVPGARRITVDEAAQIQTFPADMAWCGRRSSQYRQIGNAVPPLLAESVGRRLAPSCA